MSSDRTRLDATQQQTTTANGHGIQDLSRVGTVETESRWTSTNEGGPHGVESYNKHRVSERTKNNGD